MLEPTEDPNVFINKLTKRKVKKGSQQFCKIMMEQNEKNEHEKNEQSDNEKSPPSRKKIQKKTKKVLNEIAKENKSRLEKSKDIEGELRKLLYKKLCMTIHEHTPKNAPKKKKRSSKTYPSSSSDTSSSDTSDESE